VQVAREESSDGGVSRGSPPLYLEVVQHETSPHGTCRHRDGGVRLSGGGQRGAHDPQGGHVRPRRRDPRVGAGSSRQCRLRLYARDISGISGAVTLTGGGAYSPGSAGSADQFVHSGGGFRCTDDVGGTGLLSGCLTGQGVRWDTAGLLASTVFKCTAADSPKTAVTGDNTAVLAADFYRAGDGNDESFNANMIVSDTDIDRDVAGVQNVWIQGVGCGSATVQFSS
jgi:hypothetical protein